MIRVSNATGQSLVTVSNYDKYQASHDSSATAGATPTATSVRQDRDKEKEGLNKGNKVNGRPHVNRATQIPKEWAENPPAILSEKNLQHAINSGMTPQEASDETYKFRDWA